MVPHLAASNREPKCLYKNAGPIGRHGTTTVKNNAIPCSFSFLLHLSVEDKWSMGYVRHCNSVIFLCYFVIVFNFGYCYVRRCDCLFCSGIFLLYSLFNFSYLYFRNFDLLLNCSCSSATGLYRSPL